MRIPAAFLLLALFLALPARAADTLRVTGAPVRLAGGEDVLFMQPRWSPDGAHVAFTGPGYRGLWVVRPDGSGLRQVTDEAAAGFGFSWSADGTALLARVARFDGPRRLDAVKVFGVDDGTERRLTDYRARLDGLPHWSPGGDRVYLYAGGDLEVFDAGRAAAKTAATGNAAAPAFFVHDARLGRADLTTGAVDLVVVSAVDPGPLLNLAVSPDGAQVAFEVMGGNLYVANADGTGRVDLGRGHRPQWSPDGAYVVYMRTEDDGEQFTAADLYAARADGTARIRLTDTPDLLEMNPSWSPDGRWIAFDEANEGALYLLPVR